MDNSAAATFYIKPTTGKPKEPPFNVIPWSTQQHMFTKKENKYVEKTTFRINTQGEVQGISALGWIAHQKKISKPPIKITKTKKEKPIDIFTFDNKMMDIDSYMDLDKQMQKIMKGMNI